MKVQEKRRFERVRLHSSMAEVLGALGGRVEWPNLETSAVIDLSYKGLAVRRPGLFPVNVREQVQLQVELGGLPPFKAAVRVAWCSLQQLGLEMPELSSTGHLALRSFLDAKLLGSRLQPVTRHLFAGHQNFNYWYQGPLDTHVFVWLNSVGTIDRVNVRREESVVEIARGGRLNHLSGEQYQALLVLSQMDNSNLPMEEFVRSLSGD